MTRRTRGKRFCRACNRKDIHKKIPFSPLAYLVLFFMTFGLILFFHPRRCVCCGKFRFV